ncbi:DUF536 domain-containing protein [Listeria booriae]|uniref:DUF536 domain-containing protein n=1 Tax=Listeria booriae TaxID=1552123 RepID=UPI001623EB9D|nr:DUF536 domain-containing protein [Listeria booriae]MBC2164939.1 hypothetical protein [Listeria booriae]
MDNKNSKNSTETLFTMKMLAELANVTKPTIFRFLEKEGISEATTKGNTKYYDESVRNVVINRFTERNKNDKNNGYDNDKRTDETTLLLNELKERYSKTIDEKNSEIEYLRKALDQQQQLQAQANQNYKELQEENKKLLEHNTEENKVNKNQGWFAKLFK